MLRKFYFLLFIAVSLITESCSNGEELLKESIIGQYKMEMNEGPNKAEITLTFEKNGDFNQIMKVHKFDQAQGIYKDIIVTNVGSWELENATLIRNYKSTSVYPQEYEKTWGMPASSVRNFVEEITNTKLVLQDKNEKLVYKKIN